MRGCAELPLMSVRVFSGAHIQQLGTIKTLPSISGARLHAHTQSCIEYIDIAKS